MSDATAINTQLHRNIKNGRQYEKYMPFSDCSSITLAVGDTKVAIDNMAKWAKKYQHHTKNLAPLFKSDSLKKTCNALHDFMYNHFQYKIDNYYQDLRSPACAWATREKGIDCKSYTIFGSSVLSNLGIPHYLRRIKQAKNNGYSHVYLVVPVNPSNPKDLKNCLVIDGTLPFTSEPNYYQKDDVFMESKLPIRGLAGVTQLSLPPQVVSMAVSAIMPVVDIAVEGLVELIKGCGDTRYQFEEVKYRLEYDLKKPLTKKIAELDKAISWGHRSRIQHLFNDLFKEFDLGVAHLHNEVANNEGDSCVSEILKIALKYTQSMKDATDQFYNNFKKNFKLYEIEEFYKESSTSERDLYFVVGQSATPFNAEHRYIVLRKQDNKYGIEPVFPFEENINNWLLKNTNYLKITYSDGREFQYRKEVEPVISKILKLREKYYLGGEGLYLLEQPLQRETYKIWLRFDDNYIAFLKKEAQDLKTANELANRDFIRRLQTEVEKDKNNKKIGNLKKMAGFGAVALSTFLIVKK